ncbi:MAG: ribosome assembly cofactor RimP [Bacteroidetes bacterium]|nr:ribosome assembly cofactor RimP [Bacteroidota bacterium]
MITKDEIVKAVNEILEGTDMFLVEAVVQPSNRIAIYIDGDRSITILDCREVNHAVESRFDREQEDFDLTVSSYGIDRPLILPRQFRKNIGRELEVVAQDGSKISGILAGVSENTMELEHPVKKNKKEAQRENTILPMTEIKTAKIIIKIGK